MPLEAARSSERMASIASAARSDEATGLSLNECRALTTLVLTSERTPRLRTLRLTPARACFLADAVRLATIRRQEGIEHESGIIEAHGIRVRRQASPGASRRVHRADRRADRRGRGRGGRERVVRGCAAR